MQKLFLKIEAHTTEHHLLVRMSFLPKWPRNLQNLLRIIFSVYLNFYLQTSLTSFKWTKRSALMSSLEKYFFLMMGKKRKQKTRLVINFSFIPQWISRITLLRSILRQKTPHWTFQSYFHPTIYVHCLPSSNPNSYAKNLLHLIDFNSFLTFFNRRLTYVQQFYELHL